MIHRREGEISKRPTIPSPEASAQRTSASGAWFAAPWLIGLLLLYVIPMAACALLAFTSWDGLSSTPTWVSTRHFHSMATDRLFLKALNNSFLFAAMNVPVQLFAALGLALLVKQSHRRSGRWAILYYLPHVFGGVATILICWWLFNPQVGPINRAIGTVILWFHRPLSAMGLGDLRHLPRPPWLYSPGWAKPTLVLMNLWYAGGGMLIFLAALLRDADILHESAMIDGAGPLRRFWHLTLPHISPAILFNLVTGVVLSMQIFGPAYLLQNWQQQNSLLLFVLYIYRTAFEYHRFGYAVAMAWVLLAILIAFTAATVTLTRRWVHYDFEEGML